MTRAPTAFETLIGGLDPAVLPASPPGTDPRYCRDWSGDYAGAPATVLRPGTAAEAAGIVRRCAELGLSVVPHGGHTGLVGGATPSMAGDEVVVSLERMTRVRALDPQNFSMVVEAGCILEQVQEAAREADLYFPLALGAQGSCQIGGNASTNAGGLNVLRYGMMRDLVLGLEGVLPDGRIWDGLKVLRKNNVGYDLKQLFVGAEGTLGLVTAVALKLFPRPTQVETALVAVDSVAAAMALYATARRGLSDLLSAFELIPQRGIALALDVMPGLRAPFATDAPAYVLMEASACGAVDLKGLFEGFLGEMLETGRIADGALAASSAQAADFWRMREGMIEAQARHGRHLRTDISVPISAIPDFIAETDRRLGALTPGSELLAYGHVGDGNIHYNVLPPRDLDEAETVALIRQCEEEIFAVTDSFSGSISAEHGIGLSKRAAFLDRISPLHRDMLERIKTAFDPAGTMNPGRILPKSG
ncbi:FAD-binding oxidoreductase [Kaustia mangrovi]|nr:FAD-binding oxidoreductase [Kaustia mangrovi]